MPPAHRFGEARTGNHGLERANMRYTKAEANEMRWEEREGHKRQVIQDAFENFLAFEDGKNQYSRLSSSKCLPTISMQRKNLAHTIAITAHNNRAETHQR